MQPRWLKGHVQYDPIPRVVWITRDVADALKGSDRHDARMDRLLRQFPMRLKVNIADNLVCLIRLFCDRTSERKDWFTLVILYESNEVTHVIHDFQHPPFFNSLNIKTLIK